MATRLDQDVTFRVTWWQVAMGIFAFAAVIIGGYWVVTSRLVDQVAASAVRAQDDARASSAQTGQVRSDLAAEVRSLNAAITDLRRETAAGLSALGDRLVQSNGEVRKEIGDARKDAGAASQQLRADMVQALGDVRKEVGDARRDAGAANQQLRAEMAQALGDVRKEVGDARKEAGVANAQLREELTRTRADLTQALGDLRKDTAATLETMGKRFDQLDRKLDVLRQDVLRQRTGYELGPNERAPSVVIPPADRPLLPGWPLPNGMLPRLPDIKG